MFCLVRAPPARRRHSPGANSTSTNCPSDRLGAARGRPRRFRQITPPKADMRVARERPLVRLEPHSPDRCAARVVVLDDHAGRDRELAEQQPRRVEVEQVVERQLACLRAGRPSTAGGCARRPASSRRHAGAGSRRRAGRSPSRTPAPSAAGSPRASPGTSGRSRCRSGRCTRTPRRRGSHASSATAAGRTRAARPAPRRSSRG